MSRVNATVSDEYLAQVEQVKESADSDISDAEAVRRIFDRAQRVSELEQELRDERASHEQELAELRNEYESRITDLKQDVERLRNEKRTLINDREERMELVEYVEKEKSLFERKAKPGSSHARSGSSPGCQPRENNQLYSLLDTLIRWRIQWKTNPL